MDSACVNKDKLVNTVKDLYQEALGNKTGTRDTKSKAVQELEIGGKKYTLLVKVRTTFYENKTYRFDESKLFDVIQTLMESLLSIPGAAEQSVEKDVACFSNASGNPCTLWLSLEQTNVQH